MPKTAAKRGKPRKPGFAAECDRYEVGVMTPSGVQFLALGAGARIVKQDDGKLEVEWQSGKAHSVIKGEIVVLSRFDDPPPAPPQG